MPYYYIISAIIAFLVVGLYFLANFLLGKYFKNKPELKKILLKGLCLLFTVAFFLRYLSSNMVIKNTVGLNIHSPFGINGQKQTAFCVFTIWFTIAAVVLLQTYGFFTEKIKILKHIVKFFASPIYLINFATINMQITAMWGEEKAATISLSGTLFAVEVGIALALCTIVWIKEYRTELSWRRLGCFFACLLSMIAVAVPVFLFQVLINAGPPTLILEGFVFEHRLVLYGACIIPIIITVILYNEEYEHKRYALLFMALATMITYSIRYDFKDLLDLTSYPFHLCNLAMYIVPLCLLGKMKHLYYFTFFINVLGALLAMLMPDLGDEAYIFTASNVNFWINHYCAFFMPLLMMSLKIYERPKMKMMKYSIIGFSGYFILVLFINSYFTSIGHQTDFFFINSDFIADKLGKWAEDLRLITLDIPTSWGTPMVIYPAYQSIFFAVYVLMSFAMWYVYELGFQIQDGLEDIFRKNRKYKNDIKILEESLQGRDKNEPMNTEATDKLILRNFSKKYSTSNVYAVENASLEVNGGEIFGFLGPNGAGKSTIIKSIVGIQSISSGSIEVCGFDLEKQSVLAKKQIGFVPDHYALYENLSGREYINYIANLYGVSVEERNKRIDEYVERFHLQGSFENPIKTYSHGMKQKITIMSALVHNPKIWILDEPLTGLDPDSIFQVKEAMKQHAREGNIVFFSSHIIDVVERICDRIAIIKNGHILCDVTLKSLEEQGILLENFYRQTIENSNVERTVQEQSDERKEKKVSHSEKERKKTLRTTLGKLFNRKKGNHIIRDDSPNKGE